MALLAGDVERRVEVLGAGVDGGVVLQQQQHVVRVAEPRRDVQRRLVLSRTRVHLRAVAQQHAHDVGLVGARRVV